MDSSLPQSALIESMTKFTIARAFGDPVSVRIWRQEDNLGPHDRSDLLNLAQALHFTTLSVKEINQRFFSVDRVNAVEVVDSAGIGIVVYKDWP